MAKSKSSGSKKSKSAARKSKKDLAKKIREAKKKAKSAKNKKNSKKKACKKSSHHHAHSCHSQACPMKGFYYEPIGSDYGYGGNNQMQGYSNIGNAFNGVNSQM